MMERDGSRRLQALSCLWQLAQPAGNLSELLMQELFVLRRFTVVVVAIAVIPHNYQKNNGKRRLRFVRFFSDDSSMIEPRSYA